MRGEGGVGNLVPMTKDMFLSQNSSTLEAVTKTVELRERVCDVQATSPQECCQINYLFFCSWLVLPQYEPGDSLST